MEDYKALYFKLFNAITDSIEALKKAQIESEEECIEDPKTVEEIWFEQTGFYENYCPEGQDTMFED